MGDDPIDPAIDCSVQKHLIVGIKKLRPPTEVYLHRNDFTAEEREQPIYFRY